MEALALLTPCPTRGPCTASGPGVGMSDWSTGCGESCRSEESGGLIQGPGNLMAASAPAGAMERKPRKKRTQSEAGEPDSGRRYSGRQVSQPAAQSGGGGGQGGGDKQLTQCWAFLLLHIPLLTAAWPLRGLLCKESMLSSRLSLLWSQGTLEVASRLCLYTFPDVISGNCSALGYT